MSELVKQEDILVSRALKESRRGALASHGQNLDGVSSDAEAILAWMMQFRSSPATLRSYKRAIGVLQVFLDISGITFTDVTRPIAMQFLQWLESGECLKSEGLFRKIPSAKSREQILSAAKSFYRHMSESGYITGNPFSIKTSRAQRSNLMTQRFLNKEMLAALRAEIEDMPSPEMERWNMIITFMIALGVRRAEFCASKRDSLHQDFDGRWWWRVTGKGGKTVDLPVPDEVMTAINEYDQAMLFHRQIEVNADWYLCPSRRFGQLTPSGLYASIKKVFRRASARLAHQPSLADRLSKASPHWLRHTGLSQYAQVLTLAEVAYLGRHASMDTTGQYIHTERRDLHRKVMNFRTQSGAGSTRDGAEGDEKC